jgi:dCMP deaminase
MRMAQLVSTFSKDPSTGVGCIIADQRQRIVSTGFNGLPRSVDDTPERLNNRELKLALTLHAEQKAVLFAERDIHGMTCYTWPLPPCSRCAALLIQAGIARVVAPSPSSQLAERWGESLELAIMALREAKVTVDIIDTEGEVLLWTR